MKTDKISPVLTSSLQEEIMKPPEAVEKILILKERGWGQRRIAHELGMNRKTVKSYIRKNKWIPYQKSVRPKKLEKLSGWLEEQFHQHKGNAAVIKQELMRQHKISAGLRTIQYAVKPFRQALFAEAKATIRFETLPGKQLQIDFGSMSLEIAGVRQRVYLFAATLGYSRRQYVQAFLHERQSAWFRGMEGAFQHFGGLTEEILLDNAKALVSFHNPMTKEIVFNERLNAFARYWKFKPKACAPYRARTKGKDERTVGYIKHNCIAGRTFTSWQELEEHLSWWMHEIADKRIHGTTGERSIDRFSNRELQVLQLLNGRSPFCQIRECQRVVHTDACIEVDTNFYSVPWHLIKQQVTVQLIEEEIKILYGSEEVARHSLCRGQRERMIKAEHLEGIIGTNRLKREPVILPDLLRPLAEYEAIIGGGW